MQAFSYRLTDVSRHGIRDRANRWLVVHSPTRQEIADLFAVVDGAKSTAPCVRQASSPEPWAVLDREQLATATEIAIFTAEPRSFPRFDAGPFFTTADLLSLPAPSVRRDQSAAPGESVVSRITLVDVLRGFALFGVVVSNVAVVWGTGAGLIPESALDVRLGYLQAYLITGKFLALFSLLFGVSFGLYLRRTQGQQQSIIPRDLRRLGILLLIGALNRVLFGTDILMTYAVLGVVLLLFRNASDRTLIFGAALAIGLPELWRALAAFIGYQPAPAPVSRAERLRLATDGPWLELVRIRAIMLGRWWNELLRSASYLSLFLLGLWAARRQLLDRPDLHGLLLRRLWWGGLVLTILGFAAQAALRPGLAGGDDALTNVVAILWPATTFVQGIAYGAGIALLWLAGGRVRAVLALLGPAGRMALTNYLSVSIMITVVVLTTHTYGRVSVTMASVVGLLFWLMQVAWSTWWLRRRNFGPFEWLWRRLAYGPGWPVLARAT